MQERKSAVQAAAAPFDGQITNIDQRIREARDSLSVVSGAQSIRESLQRESEVIQAAAELMMMQMGLDFDGLADLIRSHRKTQVSPEGTLTPILANLEHISTLEVASHDPELRARTPVAVFATREFVYEEDHNNASSPVKVLSGAMGCLDEDALRVKYVEVQESSRVLLTSRLAAVVLKLTDLIVVKSSDSWGSYEIYSSEMSSAAIPLLTNPDTDNTDIGDFRDLLPPHNGDKQRRIPTYNHQIPDALNCRGGTGAFCVAYGVDQILQAIDEIGSDPKFEECTINAIEVWGDKVRQTD